MSAEPLHQYRCANEGISMKIRSEQLAKFDAAADAAFVHRMARHLRQDHPDAVVAIGDLSFEVAELDDERLHKLVRVGLARARKYGLEWESNITAFVVLMFVAAPNFDEQRAIRSVLTQEVDPESKIDLLWEHTTEQDWAAVEDAYDPNGWMRA